MLAILPCMVQLGTLYGSGNESIPWIKPPITSNPTLTHSDYTQIRATCTKLSTAVQRSLAANWHTSIQAIKAQQQPQHSPVQHLPSAPTPTPCHAHHPLPQPLRPPRSPAPCCSAAGRFPSAGVQLRCSLRSRWRNWCGRGCIAAELRVQRSWPCGWLRLLLLLPAPLS
eukprot:SAG31_NODE_100_length_25264_cov_38.715359_18_plen_169_part_00